jgi:hypothetical protein
MSKRVLSVVAWGLAGLVVALGLTAGAFALAGQEIAEPATPPAFSSPADRSGTVSSSPRPEHTQEASPSADDHGGVGSGSDDNSGSGSTSSGSGSSSSSDNSGSESSSSGSDDHTSDDHSGSGSGDDGGGDDNSGSGSGSDEDHDHDDD